VHGRDLRDTQFSIAQDARAQSAATLEKSVRPGRERLVHPIAWPAFLRALELDALDFKLRPNQIVQIDLACDHIPARRRRRDIAQAKGVAEFFKNFRGKESYLSFVLVFEIEIAIAHDAVSGHALDPRHFDGRMLIRGPAVMPEIIVRRRNVKMHDLHASTLSPVPLPGEIVRWSRRIRLSCDHSA
jgi:hypothetical protein